MDAIPRWDAASYWDALKHAIESTQAVKKISGYPEVILKDWNAFGHPSMGYYALLVLGQLLDYPNHHILNFTNILLAMFSIFCVYKILQFFLPEKKHHTEVLLATAAYAFEPLFFGCSIYLNTDFPVLVFFTAALAALLYGRYGLFAIASIFMIFSKEPGIIFWATLVGGLGLYVLWYVIQQLRAGRIPSLGEIVPHSHYKNGQPLTLWPSLYRIFCLLLPVISFKLFTIARRGAMWANDTGLKFDSNGWNCFGFNPRVIANRAGEIFVLDFHWVPAIVAFVVLFIGVGRFIERKKINETLASETIAPETITNEIMVNEKIINKTSDAIVITEINEHHEPINEHHESIEEQTPYSSEGGNEQRILIESPEHSIDLLQTAPTSITQTNPLWGILPIMFSFFGFVAFNLSYITYIIPRYVVPAGFFLLMCTIFAMHFAIKSQKIRQSILSIILVLFVVQTFRTVDPLSKLAFGTAPFSEHKILQIDSQGEAVGNGFVYNTEFTAVDKLFNLMQQAMPIKADTQIIAWNADVWYSWLSMEGVFIDPKTLKRTVDWRGTYRYNIIDITTLQAHLAPQEAFFVYMPWLSIFSSEQVELGILGNLYNISAPTEVGFQGYKLRFYKLTRRN